jgi:hypothetical protein
MYPNRWLAWSHNILIAIIIKFPFPIFDLIQFPEQQSLGVVELLVKGKFYGIVAVFYAQILYAFFQEACSAKLGSKIATTFHRPSDIVGPEGK